MTDHTNWTRPDLTAPPDDRASRAPARDGWQLVPKDPTPAMSAAGLCVSEGEHDPAGVYRAMLAAAPSAQAPTGEGATDYRAASLAQEATPAPADDVRAALDRITHSYRLLLACKSVRDVAETLAEADAALAARPEPSQDREDALPAAIAHERGENATLAGLLRDCDAVMATIQADDSDEAEKIGDLRLAITYALDPYKREGTLL